MEKTLMLISLPGKKPRLLTAKAVSASITAVRAALPLICRCSVGWGSLCWSPLRTPNTTPYTTPSSTRDKGWTGLRLGQR